MLNGVEHEKSFITSGRGLYCYAPLNRMLDLHWNMQLLSKHVRAGDYLSAGETPFKWCFAGGPIVARYCMLAEEV